MKHIMISIRPEYVCKILNREKTLEIRKSVPKEVLNGEECIVEIYCTKNGQTLVFDEFSSVLPNYSKYILLSKEHKYYNPKLNGKVVARWHLKKVDIEPYCDLSYPTPTYDGDPSMCECGMGYWLTENDCKKTCVSYENIVKYGNGKTIYLWYIDNLEIYDKPKELSEFEKNEIDLDSDTSGIGMYSYKKLTRPFQSWGYLKDEN